ncbi:MAG: hypothetical protein IMZ66_11280, partial [Planctomycetes bacterium]|nr:hypothetical protein [Planctomycetota bacterium]
MPPREDDMMGETLVRSPNVGSTVSMIRGAMVTARYEADGTLIPNDAKFHGVFVHHVLAQICELGLEEDDDPGTGGAYVTLKATAADAYEQEYLATDVPEGEKPVLLLDSGYAWIFVDDVVAWIPGDGTEHVKRGSSNVVVDGYIVPHAGHNGAVPTQFIKDHFWARLLTDEGDGEYTFGEILQAWEEGGTGTVQEVNGVAGLRVGAGTGWDAGMVVRIFKSYTGAFYFEAGTTGELDVAGGAGITVTTPSADHYKVAVNLTADPTFPGLVLTGEGDAAELQALVDNARGLDIDGDGIFVMINDGDEGLYFDTGVIKVKVKADSGLVLDGDGLAAKVKASGGLTVNSDGLQIDVTGVHQYTGGFCGIRTDGYG